MAACSSTPQSASRAGVYPKLGFAIARNCIDCHMPNQESRVVVLDVNGKKLHPQLLAEIWPFIRRSRFAENPPDFGRKVAVLHSVRFLHNLRYQFAVESARLSDMECLPMMG